MAQVFISHVQEDELLVVELNAALEAAGYSTWYYERDSVPGHSYLLQTGSAIDEAEAVILLISEHSLSSHQVTREVVRAHETNTPIVPLLVGVSHSLFQRRQPEWREAIGAAASLPLDLTDVSASLDRILRGLRALGVLPAAAPGTVPAARESAARPPAGADEDHATREAMERIARELSRTRKAFIAQCRRRNMLGKMIRNRLGLRERMEYESLFLRCYEHLNAEELFHFEQIRAITEGPLLQGNRNLLRVIESHPRVTEEVPGLEELREHLVLWLNKYERVFTRRPEMCVLYVGVEDGVPFPHSVDEDVAAWLERRG